MMKVKKIAVTSVMVFMLVVSSGEMAADVGWTGTTAGLGLGTAAGLAAYNFLASQRAKRAGAVDDIERSSGDFSARLLAFTNAVSQATGAFAPDAPAAQMSAFRNSVESAIRRVEEWFTFRDKILGALDTVQERIDTAKIDNRFSFYQGEELKLWDKQIDRLKESLDRCEPSKVPARDEVNPTVERRGSFSSYSDIPRNPSSTGRRGSFSYGETSRNPSPRRRDRSPGGDDPLVAAEPLPVRRAGVGQRVRPSTRQPRGRTGGRRSVGFDV